jgi:anti-sigma28 factor (negative regulator of flagellin synthesis)
MKVTDVKAVVGAERIKAGESATTEPAAASTPKDRVSVGVAGGQQSATAVATTRSAAGSRHAARLQQLESQVRSGGYRPDPSRVAEQILADAEVDARLQAMLDH